jgi:hypothetical protein
MNPENIENFNKSITSNEIRTVIKKFPQKKSPDLDRFTANILSEL